MANSPAHRPNERPTGRLVSVVVAALLLTGCNANQAINPSGQANRCANDAGCDPYNPISYAQNNTGTAALAVEWCAHASTIHTLARGGWQGSPRCAPRLAGRYRHGGDRGWPLD